MRFLRLTRWFALGLLAVLVPRPGRAQQLPPGYAGSAECLDCHKKDLAHFSETGHAKVMLQAPRTALERRGCEACHGPGKAHAESGGDERGGLIAFGKKQPAPIQVRDSVCLQCHDKTARMLWQGSQHDARNVACTDCHAVMAPTSERGNLKRGTVIQTCGACHAKQKNAALKPSHMPLGENAIECTNCHNPHGSPNPKLLKAASVNEVCYSCHAEKRGPFLWQHAPVVENCANCHDPHGSNHEKMLKVSRPRLCQQCHEGTGHPQQPRQMTASSNYTSVLVTDIQFLLNRQCSNCHFNIHGSNHPSGQAFTR